MTKKRFNLIKEIYKASAYYGYPFEDWFGGKERVYISLNSDSACRERSDINNDLIKKYPKVIHVANALKGSFNSVDMIDGMVYAENRSNKVIPSLSLKGKTFLLFAKKELYRDNFLSSIPQENFKISIKDLIGKIATPEVFLSNNFKINLINIFSEFYENKTDDTSFDDLNVASYLYQKLSPFSEEFILFLNDSNRKDTSSGYYVAISHNYDDIINMSNERRWTSCTSIGGAHKDVPFCEVKSGAFIAYLIKKDDELIENPLARILVRRFDSQSGESIAIAEDSVYGENIDGFQETLDKWIESKQGVIKPGFYYRKGGGYSDTFKESANLFGDSEELIRAALEKTKEEGFVAKDRLKFTFMPNYSYHIMSSNITILSGSPFFSTKEELKKSLESLCPDKHDAYDVAELMRNERMRVEHAGIVDNLSSDWQFEDQSEYEAVYESLYQTRYEKIQSQIVKLEDDKYEIMQALEDGKDTTDNKVWDEMMASHDKIEELIDDLNEKEYDLHDNIEEELAFSEAEEMVRTKAYDVIARFEVVSINKEDYVENIKEYNSEGFHFSLGELKNVSKRKNNIPKQIWLDQKSSLSPDTWNNALLNDPNKFEDEFANILDDIEKETFSLESALDNVYIDIKRELDDTSSLQYRIRDFENIFGTSRQESKGNFVQSGLKSNNENLLRKSNVILSRFNSLLSHLIDIFNDYLKLTSDLTEEELLSALNVKSLNEAIEIISVRYLSIFGDSLYPILNNSLAVHLKPEVLSKLLSFKDNVYNYVKNIYQKFLQGTDANMINASKLANNVKGIERIFIAPSYDMYSLYKDDEVIKILNMVLGIEYGEYSLSKNMVDKYLSSKTGFISLDAINFERDVIKIIKDRNFTGMTSRNLSLDQAIDWASKTKEGREYLKDSLLEINRHLRKSLVQFSAEIKSAHKSLKAFEKSFKDENLGNILNQKRRTVLKHIEDAKTLFNGNYKRYVEINKLYGVTKQSRLNFFKNLFIKYSDNQ